MDVRTIVSTGMNRFSMHGRTLISMLIACAALAAGASPALALDVPLPATTDAVQNDVADAAKTASAVTAPAPTDPSAAAPEVTRRVTERVQNAAPAPVPQPRDR